MERQITHPTKEQVRAYMARRGAAPCPPPAPDEIRRELGWRLAPTRDEQVLLRFCLLPSTYGQLMAQFMLDWLLAPSRVICVTGTADKSLPPLHLRKDYFACWKVRRR